MRILILLVSLLAVATPAKAIDFVWVGPNYVPCDHPIAIYAGLGCTHPLFKVKTGATYEHLKAGWKFYIVGPIQRQNGKVVMLAEVIRGTDVWGRQLFEDGTLIETTDEWPSAEWREVPK